MNYLSIYTEIINRGKNRLRFPGCDRHRITPGYQKGTYNKENISYLTRQEHRIVHLLRWKIWNHYADICAAKHLGSKSIKGYKLPPFTEEHKRKIREKRSLQIITEEHKQHISESIKGIKHPLWGKHHSQKTKQLMSKNRKGKKKKPFTEEHKRNLSKSKIGSKNPNSGPHLWGRNKP